MSSGRWPPHVSARAADYADLQALGTALRDVDTLVFVSSDGPVAEVVVHHQNVIRAAGDSGIAHIIALSGLDADLSSPFCYALSYGYTERLLATANAASSAAAAASAATTVASPRCERPSGAVAANCWVAWISAGCRPA